VSERGIEEADRARDRTNGEGGESGKETGGRVDDDRTEVRKGRGK